MWRKPNEEQQQPKASPAPIPIKPEEPIKQAAPVHAAPSAPVTVMPAPTPVSSNVSKITSGLMIKGEISGDSDLYIDGEVQGKIRSVNGRVTVGPNGRVQAEIEARQISIEGKVQGNMKAGESAQLGASSAVTGSLLTPRIGIADGAKMRGKIETVRAPQPAKPLAFEAPESEDRHETIGAKTE